MLVDGAMSIYDAQTLLELEALPDGDFNTLAGSFYRCSAEYPSLARTLIGAAGVSRCPPWMDCDWIKLSHGVPTSMGMRKYHRAHDGILEAAFFRVKNGRDKHARARWSFTQR